MNQSSHRTKSTVLVLFLVFSGVGQVSCNLSNKGHQQDNPFLNTTLLPVVYDLQNPLEKHFLPYVLTELSGLTYLDSTRLLCVQDEKGKVYEYDHIKREIVKVTEFYNGGDYEGLEMVGDTVYVVESDGDVYAFDYFSGEMSATQRFETKLTSDNNIEGLGYHIATNQLLIACKGKGSIRDKEVKGKAVYAFDLKKNKLNKEPFFNIRAKDIVDFVEDKRGVKLKEKDVTFKPSGIAVSPLDNLIYLLAFSGKVLLVLDETGDIKGTYPLPRSLLLQPESICFAPNGDLFIGSEGQGGKGYILKFEAKRK
ncbi:MAG: SdiA-regulated domain-containing protein [Cyclobacteriaceae bacterium]